MPLAVQPLLAETARSSAIHPFQRRGLALDRGEIILDFTGVTDTPRASGTVKAIWPNLSQIARVADRSLGAFPIASIRGIQEAHVHWLAVR